jgi:hypothetical protein
MDRSPRITWYYRPHRAYGICRYTGIPRRCRDNRDYRDYGMDGPQQGDLTRSLSCRLKRGDGTIEFWWSHISIR